MTYRRKVRNLGFFLVSATGNGGEPMHAHLTTKENYLTLDRKFIYSLSHRNIHVQSTKINLFYSMLTNKHLSQKETNRKGNSLQQPVE